ncbi:MAG: preprotein translocase subunit, partial [Pseudomonadota bacterium]
QHYESRKHILEYDDVANHQRKAIYTFRNQLLDPTFDIGAKIKENRAEYIQYLLIESEIIAGMPTEDFDVERLSALIKEELNLDLSSALFKGKEVDEITLAISEAMEAHYDAKMSQIHPEQREEIERILYLQVLDPQWRDHLYEMDVLKTGIGLRGYNQKDPLTEYKQDSYKLFTDLVSRIKIEAVKVLQLVQFNFESLEEEAAAVEHIREELEHDIAQTKLSTDTEEQTEKKTPLRSTKKAKRNDPCPCGSGEKYKNCCGQSGPKKGLLA